MIYINGLLLNVTMFPDNTSQVWKVKTLDIPDTNYVHIRWDFEHEGEFMHLAQLKHLTSKLGFRASLQLDYLPYARQDKVVDNNATFALRTFAKLLNTLEFESIRCMDPHSHIAKDIITNFEPVYPKNHVHSAVCTLNTDLVCYPDAGALDKYTDKYALPYVWGMKKRDQSTGNITNYELVGVVADCRILIVDDICDGGATFVLLAAALYKAGAKEVNLYVTHGIFSKGLKPLKDAGIKRVFTFKGEVSEVQNNICYNPTGV